MHLNPCYIDWNCHLISGCHEFMTDSDEAASALSYLCTERNIQTFCMMPSFYPSVDSVAHFIIRRDRSVSALLRAYSANPTLQLLSGASVALEPNLYLTEHLPKLTIKIQNFHYLPIQLPIAEFEDWIDLEINRLLYRGKYQLLFLSFDLLCMFYPMENIKKFMRISNAVFQFNYRSLENPMIRKIISSLIQNNATVLLGTSLNRKEKIYHYDIPYYLKIAEEAFSSAEFAILMKYNQKLPVKHPPILTTESVKFNHTTE